MTAAEIEKLVRGDWLKEQYKTFGIKQGDLVEPTGIGQGTISEIENNHPRKRLKSARIILYYYFLSRSRIGSGS